MLLLLSSPIWHHGEALVARAIFANQVSAVLPTHAPLFAVPELDNTDATVIAYRLGREILRKPISCGDTNDYLLVPLDSLSSVGGESRALVSSEHGSIALITLLTAYRFATTPTTSGRRCVPFATETVNAPGHI